MTERRDSPPIDEKDPKDPDADAGRDWRPRPRRLLIGVGLVVIGLVWSIIASSNTKRDGSGSTPIVFHRAVDTQVQLLDEVRVRPQLFPNANALAPAVMQISFHNDGRVSWLISPDAIRLEVAGTSFAPTGVGRQDLQPMLLQSHTFITADLHFSHALAPGASLVFAPAWAHGHSLRWLLWS